MKFQIVLSVLVIFAVSSVRSIDIERTKTMLRGIALECKVNEDASDDDLTRLVGMKPIESKEGKCMIACILEQMGIMDEGKFLKNGFIEYGKDIVEGNTKALKMIADLAEECGVLKANDRCELAIMTMGCIKMGSMKLKLELGI